MATFERRRFIQTAVAVGTAGLIAGCADDPDDEPAEDTDDEGEEPTDDADPDDDSETVDDEDDHETGDEEETGEDEETDEETGDDEETDEDEEADDEETDEEADEETGDEDEETVEEHLAPAPNYGGTITDLTGRDSVRIEVGDPDGGTNYVFDPPAVEIDAGTTVIWEWIDGDPHSVTHTNGDAFDSGTEAETEFEHDFGEAGTYLYHCFPHQDLGMVGAIVVV